MNVKIKGMDDKLMINLDTGDWSVRSEELINYVRDNAAFLSGAKVVLCLDNFRLKVNDLFELKNSFADYKLAINGIQSNQDETRQAARLIGIPLDDQLKSKEQSSNSKRTIDHGEKNLFLTRTLRSGSLTETIGNITLVGDVHPGAVIKATGSVIVWGKLSGEIHAGINGDFTSVVSALMLSPSHLSIADLIFDLSSRKSSKSPQIARCIENAITIETWKS